jgi:hypothetical protein
MNKPEQLITVLMAEIAGRLEEANHELCTIIDSLCDENQKPLPYVSLPLVEKLKDIAHGLYELHDIELHEMTDDMTATMKHFYKPKM